MRSWKNQLGLEYPQAYHNSRKSGRRGEEPSMQISWWLDIGCFLVSFLSHSFTLWGPLVSSAPRFCRQYSRQARRGDL
jgi:hypothetical protein